MRKALRRFWCGLLEMLDICECGGRYVAWDERRAFCDRCERRQFDEDIRRCETRCLNGMIDNVRLASLPVYVSPSKMNPKCEGTLESCEARCYCGVQEPVHPSCHYECAL